MASPLITTVPFTAQNITIANEVASYTIPASGQYQFQCKLTGLDPDAANLTPCLNRYDADTNWIGCVGDPNRMISKANADDTAECFAFASFFAVAEESVALSLLSSNAADTAVGGGLEVWDAMAANLTAVNGTTFDGAAVPLPGSGAMPLPDVLLLAAAVYGLNVRGVMAEYLYCTGIDGNGHLTFSSIPPGSVAPFGYTSLAANSAGTTWTIAEHGADGGPWTNNTLWGQFNDGGSPPTSCAVTIAAPRVDASGNIYAVDNNDNPLGTADGQTSILAAISAVPAAVWTVLTATLTAANTVGKWVTGLFTAAGYTAPPSAGTIAAAVAGAVPTLSEIQDASTFSGAFPAGVVKNAPIGSPDASSTIGVGTISDGHITAYQFGAFENPDGSPISITVNDQNGNPISLAGKTLEMVVYGLGAPTAALWTWSTSDALSIAGDSQNVILLSADATHSGQAGTMRWVVWDVTIPTAPVQKARGTLAIIPNQGPT